MLELSLTSWPSSGGETVFYKSTFLLDDLLNSDIETSLNNAVLLTSYCETVSKIAGSE